LWIVVSVFADRHFTAYPQAGVIWLLIIERFGAETLICTFFTGGAFAIFPILSSVHGIAVFPKPGAVQRVRVGFCTMIHRPVEN